MSIYIGNFSYRVTLKVLGHVFAEYSAVKRLQIPPTRETSHSRGWGFAKRESNAEENTAIQEPDGVKCLGRSLRVNAVKPRAAQKTSGNYSRSY
jgi:RNA recognition motif-containing protein